MPIVSGLIVPKMRPTLNQWSHLPTIMTTDHGTVLIHIHINHDLGNGVVIFLCKGERVGRRKR